MKPEIPSTKEEIETFCKEYIEREFGIQREVKHHPGKTAIPRETIREAVREIVSKGGKRIRVKSAAPEGGGDSIHASIDSVPLNVVPIPKAFLLGGKVFYVEFSDTLLPQENANGDHWFDLSRIRLQRSSAGFPTQPDHIEQTFWHEAIHGVLHTAGKSGLAKDEELVMQIAHGVHQILKTAVYD